MERSRYRFDWSPVRLTTWSLSLWVGIVLAAPAEGGPNQGGVIILHRNEGMVYSPGISYCGQSGLDVCDNAVTRFDATDIVVLHALAAFPGDSFPRLAGVVFGVTYNEATIEIVEWGSCGDFELPNGGWPGSNQGTAVTWNEAQTGHLTQIYWFAAYEAYGNPATLALMGHPSGGGNFGDDAVPSNVDPIAGYGSFGFNVDGVLPCPFPPPTESILELVPEKIAVYQPCGGSFGVDLRVNDIYDLTAFEVCLGYNPAFLDFDQVVIDPSFLGSTGRDVFALPPVACPPTCQPSGIRFGAYTVGPENGPSGSGRLATIRFSTQGTGGGTDSLCLQNWELTNDDLPPVVIPLSGVRGLQITHLPFCYGDFTGDGDVTVFDLARIIPKWRCCAADACYSPTYDVNLLEREEYCASTSDGCINAIDIQTVAGRWHQGCAGNSSRSGALPIVTAPPSVRISPQHGIVSAQVGDTTSVAVVVDNALDLGAFEAGLGFDPAVVEVETVVIGSFLNKPGRTVYGFTPQIDNLAGTVCLGACSVGATPGPNGSGVLARVVFRILACGETTALDLTDVLVTFSDGWPQDLESVTGGSLEIGCASAVPTGPEATDYVFFPPRPNPLSSTTELQFSLPASAGAGSPVRLDVFGAAGRHVRTLIDQNLGMGLHRVVWDARDESGRVLPAGTYFCRLTFGGKALKMPIQLVR